MTSLRLEEFSVFTLKPLDLDISNECICITGPSGSGKSLLLRAIADLILHNGEAYLDNKKCSEINPVQWRKSVGFLPAESSWWMDKVGDHFGDLLNDNDKTVALEKLLKQLDLPLDSLHWNLSRCSTGEKQRFAIARLLQQQPKVLLLDEPTASLDANSVLRVEALIKDYARENKTPIIWVSHDKQQVKRIADRLLEIEKDEIREISL